MIDLKHFCYIYILVFLLLTKTAKKMTFSVEDLFSKCDHSLVKSLMEKIVCCAVMGYVKLMFNI